MIRAFVALLLTSAIGCAGPRHHQPSHAQAEPERATAPASEPGPGAEPRATQHGTDRGAASPEIHDQQIQFLQRLVKSTEQSDPEYPNYLFRLADEYIETKYDLEQLAYSLDDQIYAARDSANSALASQLLAQQASYVSQARAASEAALVVYRALIDDPRFASYPRLDEALYVYGFERGQLGDQAQMQATYLRLIKDFPASPHVPHAYLSFGDHYFSEGEIEKAIQFYEKVTRFGPSPVQAYAHYKLGWCHLNSIGQDPPQYGMSFMAFVAAIEISKQGPAGSEASAKQLRREARRDLVRVYVHVGKPNKARELFEKLGNGPDADEQDARKMMELLAQHYADEGKLAESRLIQQQLESM